LCFPIVFGFEDQTSRQGLGPGAKYWRSSAPQKRPVSEAGRMCRGTSPASRLSVPRPDLRRSLLDVDVSPFASSVTPLLPSSKLPLPESEPPAGPKTWPADAPALVLWPIPSPNRRFWAASAIERSKVLGLRVAPKREVVRRLSSAFATPEPLVDLGPAKNSGCPCRSAQAAEGTFPHRRRAIRGPCPGQHELERRRSSPW